MTVAVASGAATVDVRGDWTIRTVSQIEAEVGRIAQDRPAKDLVLDLHGLGRLDTAGALMLNRLINAFLAAGGKSTLDNVLDIHSVLIEGVRANDKPPLKPAKKHNSVAAFVEHMGERGIAFWREALEVLTVLGGAARSLALSVLSPRTFRYKSFTNHLERTALNAVPIIGLMSFLIGAILAQQGAFYFRQFGADLYVVDMVGVLTLREIGVLLTAIMVAGRSGSAFTAELGSMKMREEVDALRVIGLDPVEVLVLPRILALIVALPILTFVSDLMSLLGAAVACVTYAGIPLETFTQRLNEAVELKTFFIGLSKAPFMGIIFALFACVVGLRVEGSAESLGRQTTVSVVKSIFMVIVVDGIFAIFYATAGL